MKYPHPLKHLHPALRPLGVFGWLLVLLATSGCFMQAATDVQSTPVSLNLPTITPIPPTETPTETPSPTEDMTLVAIMVMSYTPTDTPTLTETPTETPPPLAFNEFTETPTETPSETPTPMAVAQVSDDEAAGLTATALIAQETQFYLDQTSTAQMTFLLPTATNTPEVFLPTATFTPDVSSGPVLTGADCVHEVQAGNNLFRLSLYYGLSINEIAVRNGITNINFISLGQKLVIPGCGTTGNPPPPTSIPTNTVSGVTSDGSVVSPSTSGGTSTCGGRYIVQQYDSLFGISLRCNVSIADIQALNPTITNINLIYIQQELVLP